MARTPWLRDVRLGLVERQGVQCHHVALRWTGPPLQPVRGRSVGTYLRDHPTEPYDTRSVARATGAHDSDGLDKDVWTYISMDYFMKVGGEWGLRPCTQGESIDFETAKATSA